MAEILRRGLGEEGYLVDVAGRGDEGLRLATVHEYVVVILDGMLPGMDGVEVCHELRRRGVWVPVLMLTARDAVLDRITGLDAGADDYLTKPFNFGELKARVRAMARRRAAADTEVLKAGGLTLDIGTHRCRRGEAEIELSAREFALLELFMRNADAVLSREQIRDSVWDLGYLGESNVVDQYVSYLRRKIDRPFGCEQLQTVRGLGYRLRSKPLEPA